MKKITAVISAAAIAAAMMVPITAGAAEIVGDDFSTDKTVYWTPNTYYSSVSDGALTLSSLTSGISKSVAVSGNFTFNFDVTTGGNSVDNFYAQIQYKVGETTKTYNVLDIYRGTSETHSNGRIRIGGTAVSVYRTGATSTTNVFLTPSKTYNVTVDVNGNKGYLTIVGTLNYSDASVTNYEFDLPTDYTSLSAIKFYDYSSTKTSLLLDNVSITTPDTPVVEASAETTKVTAAINGSVTIGGTTVTGVSSENVKVGDKYISFYKTTVTAGDKAVNGMTIKPKDYEGAAANVTVNAAANGGTDSFYTAVINNSDAVITDWTYTYVE